MAGIKWSKEELEKLKKQFPIKSREELHKLFPDRSFYSIQLKANRIGAVRENPCPVKYTVNSNFFENPNLLNSYWAGFIAADGCITNGKFEIALAQKDLCHLEQLKLSLNFTGNITHQEGKPVKIGKRETNYIGQPQNRIRFKDSKIVNDLFKIFGITERKSLTLLPPINLTFEQSLAFIVGYIDGDGSVLINPTKGLPVIDILGTKDICSWIEKLINENTPENNFIKSKTSLVKNSRIFHYNFSGNRAVVFYNLIKDLEIPKLARKWDVLKNYEYVPKKKREKGYKRRTKIEMALSRLTSLLN